MTDADLLVTLSVGALRELIRGEVKAAMRERGPVPEKPPVLTSDQAAAYLQMPVATLRKKTALGEVPSFKIGAVLRYRRAELDAWIANDGKAKAG